LQLEQRRDGPPNLQAVIDRIGVLGQLYAHLTPKEGHTAVAAVAFLEDLVNGLCESHEDGWPVELRLRAEPMRLPLPAAMALGLITHELVTKAFKYAFPGERLGRIDAELRRTADTVELVVADDGVGHDPTGPARGGGLGRMLVEQSARQLWAARWPWRGTAAPGWSCACRSRRKRRAYQPRPGERHLEPQPLSIGSAAFWKMAME
jgi:two-component sensor histidine kinase